MAFILRRPLSVSSAVAVVSKGAFKPSTFRSFHNAPFRAQASNLLPRKPAASPTALLKSKSAFSKTFQRTYMQNPSPYQAPVPEGASLTQKLVLGGALFGGTLLAINLVFNRETREDGGMPDYERAYLNDTFLHTGLGVGIIGVAASALHRSGWSYRLMAMNPWLVVGSSLVVSIGSMYLTFATPPENYVMKYGAWTAFNLAQAAVLAPLFFYQPAILARAGLYTIGMMGSIAIVGATAKQEKYLYLGAPLLGGVAIVALSGLAPLVLPATAIRTLMWSERIWLYGGLAVFGGFTLYDVQKILHHARLAEAGMVRKDVVNESISLELDFLNIFIRMVQILGAQQRRK